MTAHDDDAAAPLVGISGRSVRGHQLPEVPRQLATSVIDLHFRDYSDAVALAGGLPVQLSMSARPEQIARRLDAVVLSGGADIDPRRYGEAPAKGLGAVDLERDDFEFALFSAALELGIPVLGICRGMQLINVAYGGTLHQDINADPDLLPHEFMVGPPEYTVHDVAFVAGSLAARLYGDSYRTTSAHHQSAARIGNGLVASGHTSDGVVEVVEHPTSDVLGVQWHAERHATPDPAFDWLISAARRRPRHLDSERQREGS